MNAVGVGNLRLPEPNRHDVQGIPVTSRTNYSWMPEAVKRRTYPAGEGNLAFSS